MGTNISQVTQDGTKRSTLSIKPSNKSNNTALQCRADFNLSPFSLTSKEVLFRVQGERFVFGDAELVIFSVKFSMY